MTNEEAKAHIDMLIAHKDKALKTHPYFNGATNGDVIKMLFPNIEVYQNVRSNVHAYIGIVADITAQKEWWDAPYREGDKNE